MKSDRKRPVAVEDLLRLKRAERPAAEFWVQFDRELRAKQLAALVEKRPWWQRVAFRPVFAGVARWSLPIGATAALAVSFFALREAAPPHPEPVSAPAAVASLGESTSAPAVIAMAALPSPGRESAAEETTVPVSPAAEPSVLEATPSAVIAATLPVEPVTELAAIIPLLGSAPAAAAADAAPSARLIAGNLAGAAGPVEPLMKGTLLGGVRAFETRAATARAAVDPLQQMASPGERSRARLLTAMVSMASSDDSSRTAERVAGRIDEERLYDQVSRVGARGDRVNWRF